MTGSVAQGSLNNSSGYTDRTIKPKYRGIITNVYQPSSKPTGVNSLYVCTARGARCVRRNHCSFVTTQMVDRNEGLDLPTDSRFYTCAESEKLYHHCCIDSAGYARVQIPFPSGIIKIPRRRCRRKNGISNESEKIERKIEEQNRRENLRREMRPRKRQYEGKQSRFSHLPRKG